MEILEGSRPEMEEVRCRLCGRPLGTSRLDAEEASDTHWMCYHFAYEHDADPDQPCSDVTCPLRQNEIFRECLRQLGQDPEQLLLSFLDKTYCSRGTSDRPQRPC
jgi:hypothetical protein